MIDQSLLQRIGELIIKGDYLFDQKIATYDAKTHISSWEFDLFDDIFSWEASCLNLIFIVLGQRNHYYERFPRFVIPDPRGRINEPMPDWELKVDIKKGLGILSSIRDEINSDLLRSQDIIITKDLLLSISDEARALLKANYFPAAAIYCRVYLENMVKKLADKNNIVFSKDTRLGALCEELKNKEIINLPDWRQIQAWADLGNEAAHGNFENCIPTKISTMISGLEQIEQQYLK
jgi:hypothetical protein